MIIKLYNNSSDQRVLSKSISQVGSDMNVRLLDECTVENPAFKMAYDPKYLTANYIYVPDWGKYYYITSRNILNAAEIYIECHIDVLMSFKNAIRNTDIIAERSSSNVNPYIPDDVCRDRGTVQQIFRRCTTTPFTLQTNCYVLHVSGKTSRAQEVEQCQN